jgi:hypothetical protein
VRKICLHTQKKIGNNQVFNSKDLWTMMVKLMKRSKILKEATRRYIKRCQESAWKIFSWNGQISLIRANKILKALLFKLNDNVSINNIIKNHNIHDTNPAYFKDCYMKATSEPRQFLMIDMKGDKDKHLRQKFLNFY